MKRHIRATFIATALVLSAYATADAGSPTTLILGVDGQLAALTLASFVPLLPIQDQGAVSASVTAIEGAVTAYQGGATTSATFVNSVKQEVTNVEPILVADLKSNEDAEFFVKALRTLVGELVTTDTGIPAATTLRANSRQFLRAWIANHPPSTAKPF
jgi:hypothetical protein